VSHSWDVFDTSLLRRGILKLLVLSPCHEFMVGHRHQGVYAKSAFFSFPLVLSLTAASYFMLLLDAKLHCPIKSGNLGKIRSETSHFFLRKNYKRKDSFRKCICGKFAISSVINFKNIKNRQQNFLSASNRIRCKIHGSNSKCQWNKQRLFGYINKLSNV